MNFHRECLHLLYKQERDKSEHYAILIEDDAQKNIIVPSEMEKGLQTFTCKYCNESENLENPDFGYEKKVYSLSKCRYSNNSDPDKIHRFHKKCLVEYIVKKCAEKTKDKMIKAFIDKKFDLIKCPECEKQGISGDTAMNSYIQISDIKNIFGMTTYKIYKQRMLKAILKDNYVSKEQELINKKEQAEKAKKDAYTILECCKTSDNPSIKNKPILIEQVKKALNKFKDRRPDENKPFTIPICSNCDKPMKISDIKKYHPNSAFIFENSEICNVCNMAFTKDVLRKEAGIQRLNCKDGHKICIYCLHTRLKLRDIEANEFEEKFELPEPKDFFYPIYECPEEKKLVELAQIYVHNNVVSEKESHDHIVNFSSMILQFLYRKDENLKCPVPKCGYNKKYLLTDLDRKEIPLRSTMLGFVVEREVKIGNEYYKPNDEKSLNKLNIALAKNLAYIYGVDANDKYLLKVRGYVYLWKKIVQEPKHIADKKPKDEGENAKKSVRIFKPLKNDMDEIEKLELKDYTKYLRKVNNDELNVPIMRLVKKGDEEYKAILNSQMKKLCTVPYEIIEIRMIHNPRQLNLFKNYEKISECGPFVEKAVIGNLNLDLDNPYKDIINMKWDYVVDLSFTVVNPSAPKKDIKTGIVVTDLENIQGITKKNPDGSYTVLIAQVYLGNNDEDQTRLIKHGSETYDVHGIKNTAIYNVEQVYPLYVIKYKV